MTKRRVILWVSAVLFLGLQGVGVWQILSLRERLADAEWSIAYQVKKLEDTIIPDVGTIQFLRRGYSIEIEAAKYTADGLTLQGSVGNPLNLTLHNLTLKFTARFRWKSAQSYAPQSHTEIHGHKAIVRVQG